MFKPASLGSIVVFTTLAAAVLVPAGLAFAAPLEREAELARHRVDWVTVDGEQIAYGAGGSVYLKRHGVNSPAASVRLALDVEAGLLAGERLYLGAGGGLYAVHTDRADAAPTALLPARGGTLRLARHGDHLIVADETGTLRLLALPSPHAAHAGHGAEAELTQVGSLTLPQRPVALAASRGRAYAALADRRIAVIDIRAPDAPVLLRTVPVDSPVRALAANGGTLFLLSPGGLDVISVDGPAPRRLAVHGEARGVSIDLSGRSIYVASLEAGLEVFRDPAAEMATVFVTVGNNFFNPQMLDIDVGDTVQWDRTAGFSQHNVQSCTVGQLGCPGAATEAFTSGPPTSAAFSFSHTFTMAGSNPYVCIIHTPAMTGRVTVTSVAAPPPGEALDLRVSGRDTLTGDISITYGPACGSADNHIELGLLQDVSTYAYSGQDCSIGNSGSYDAFNPGADSYFFLVVANDGSGTEGSYGKDSQGAERPDDTLDPSCSLTQDLVDRCDATAETSRIDATEETR